jgi:pilus assembly protein CpaE
MSSSSSARTQIMPVDLQADVAEPQAPRARPVPRISIEAFVEDPGFADVMSAAAADRRLARCQSSTASGGLEGAVQHYVVNPTPDLIILDTSLPRDRLLPQLDALAEHCDAGTKVIICGRINDVLLYRELLKRGVSEYLVSPVQPGQLLESISNLYSDPASAPIGHAVAFVGAKGGVGASTLCHNTAWCLSEQLRANVVIADLDLAFGTTGLDFNQDPVQGIADALAAPERMDDVLLDRLLTKCTQHLSIFAAPVVLDRDYDLDPASCQHVLDVVRQNVPFVVLDLPHLWSSWNKQQLLQADEIVVVAEPDLANLRNTKNILDFLKQTRRNDNAPHVVLNRVGMPKRPEIPVKDFCQSLEVIPTAIIEYDADSFGQAANNGQMLEEAAKKAKAVAQIRDLARVVSHRKDGRAAAAKPASPVQSLLEKLKLKL